MGSLQLFLSRKRTAALLFGILIVSISYVQFFTNAHTPLTGAILTGVSTTTGKICSKDVKGDTPEIDKECPVDSVCLRLEEDNNGDPITNNDGNYQINSVGKDCNGKKKGSVLCGCFECLSEYTSVVGSDHCNKCSEGENMEVDEAGECVCKGVGELCPGMNADGRPICCNRGVDNGGVDACKEATNGRWYCHWTAPGPGPGGPGGVSGGGQGGSNGGAGGNTTGASGGGSGGGSDGGGDNGDDGDTGDTGGSSEAASSNPTSSASSTSSSLCNASEFECGPISGITICCAEGEVCDVEPIDSPVCKNPECDNAADCGEKSCSECGAVEECKEYCTEYECINQQCAVKDDVIYDCECTSSSSSSSSSEPSSSSSSSSSSASSESSSAFSSDLSSDFSSNLSSGFSSIFSDNSSANTSSTDSSGVSSTQDSSVLSSTDSSGVSSTQDSSVLSSNAPSSVTSSNISSDAASNGTESSIASAFSSAVPLTCGDGVIDLGEQCDNGSVCSQDVYRSCQDNADCNVCAYVGFTDVLRCGGSPTGQTCSSHAECANGPYQCEYDTVINFSCSNECRYIGSSSVSSSVVSSSTSSDDSSSEESSVVSSSTSSDVSSVISSSAQSSTDNDDTFNRSGGCGNGVVEHTEECDDGNNINGDGCSSRCEREQVLVAAASVCGNGVLEINEECDDRNRRDNDGCSSTCLLEVGICGDGIVQSLLGEQCEQSKHDDSTGYNCSNCRFVSNSCGDGVLDAGEECDNGALNSALPDEACRPDCSLARCGDLVLDTSEECDDGNRVSNDGCNRFCLLEGGVPTGIVAGENTQNSQNSQGPASILGVATQFQFPQYPTQQPAPYQLPYAQLQPLIQTQGPVGDTGPAAVAVVASGMAAGLGWMRRKKK